MKNDFRESVFRIINEQEFNEAAMAIFRYQVEASEIYSTYAGSLGKLTREISGYHEIPFLPIEFFKKHKVQCGTGLPEKVFLSSGTTGAERSRHLVQDLDVYRVSLHEGFRKFYGDPAGWNILALMPSPDENPDSSLVYMTAQLMNPGFSKVNGFFLRDFPALDRILRDLSHSGGNTLLIGLSYALLDYVEKYPVSFPGLTVMETGGMKGRRREMIREELHSVLCRGFGCPAIHSEYGMTELLSQAYAQKDGIYSAPPWMKIFIRDINDPFHLLEPGEAGGINIIDLANFGTCSFLSTRDVGSLNPDGTFRVLGRFDHSDLRGCNLMTL